ncbi:MAG TPA: hypothetical protein VLJ13_02620 [Brevundimonas sp.]|nr:hypothetical protein [Brevundimonas sp.]
MDSPEDRRLDDDRFAALKAEVLRAAVELSDDQLLDLTDSLHAVMRLRRPGRLLRHPDGWVTDELRNFA